MLRCFLSGVLLFCAMCRPVWATDVPIPVAVFDYAPFMYEDGSGVHGTLIDAANVVFSRMGRRPVYRLLPPGRALQATEVGETAIMLGVRRTPEREKTLMFSQEAVLVQEVVVFVRANSRLNFDGDLKRLADVPLGLVGWASYGPVFDAAVKRGEFARIDFAPNFEANFKKLLAGHVDIVVNSRATGLGVLAKIPGGDQIQVLGPPIERLDSYAAFPKTPEGAALAAAFDRGVVAAKRDGAFSQVIRKAP